MCGCADLGGNSHEAGASMITVILVLTSLTFSKSRRGDISFRTNVTPRGYLSSMFSWSGFRVARGT